ncbi:MULTISPECIES: hypothetical protein [unclassified Rhodococcus (in: high G+C Gram-positive bacteria)]|uniref:hypothetical protein n=1 Tax=unclassified Rhodococcus (in: high G+C Gram-positive bacteria) TaxID=192944 RepID=UPI0007BB414F|nr:MULTISPECIES: hypothetical protein [unclassified Rhodococcus (in: high G+C Gram-positive bacteria)]KZF11345.1 hypothetical protein A2J02_15325 [Rhodococcus sp. EPR-147]KZF12356.1 hypothetical protein A2J04_16975 [Rhodococcus sp. EPR-279]
MVDSPPNLIAHWQELNAKADAGTVTIPADVAAKCDGACVAYLAHLKKMQVDAHALTEVKSWGDLKSAQDLQAKFLSLATGTDRSLDIILQQHIDVIESMRMLFRRYFQETSDTDERTSADITALTPEN